MTFHCAYCAQNERGRSTKIRNDSKRVQDTLEYNAVQASYWRVGSDTLVCKIVHHPVVIAVDTPLGRLRSAWEHSCNATIKTVRIVTNTTKPNLEDTPGTLIITFLTREA